MYSIDARPEFSLTADLSFQLGYFFPKDSLPNQLQQNTLAIGQIKGKFYGKTQKVGTCFVAEVNGQTQIVSARHCFTDQTNRKLESRLIILGSGRSIQFEPKVAQDSPKLAAADLLIFPIKKELTQEILKLSQKPLVLADKVVVIGYPESYLKIVSSRGPVASIGEVITTGGQGKSYSANVRVEPGNSGSPVLNQEGKVVGVVSRCDNGYFSFDDSQSRRLGTICFFTGTIEFLNPT